MNPTLCSLCATHKPTNSPSPTFHASSAFLHQLPLLLSMTIQTFPSLLKALSYFPLSHSHQMNSSLLSLREWKSSKTNFTYKPPYMVPILSPSQMLEEGSFLLHPPMFWSPSSLTFSGVPLCYSSSLFCMHILPLFSPLFWLYWVFLQAFSSCNVLVFLVVARGFSCPKACGILISSLMASQ